MTISYFWFILSKLTGFLIHFIATSYRLKRAELVESHATSENISTYSVTVRSHFLATTGMGLKRVLNWTFTATHYGTWAKVIWVGTFLELRAFFKKIVNLIWISTINLSFLFSQTNATEEKSFIPEQYMYQTLVFNTSDQLDLTLIFEIYASPLFLI